MNSKKRAVIRTERKRQQCKTAAKSRRLTESDIFNELMQTLPTVDHPTIYQLDRIGAVRLASMLCRTRNIGEKFLSASEFKGPSRKVPTGPAVVSFLKDLTSQISIDLCLEGFIVIVNKAGQMLFVTESVADTLGFTQTDLVGRYLREYVHEEDWNELRGQLCTAGNSNAKKNQLMDSKVLFRMKTALTPRGKRARKLTMAVYEPLQATVIKPSEVQQSGAFDGFECGLGGNSIMNLDDEIRFMYCTPFGLSSTRRFSLSSVPTIMSRHELNMHFRICDEKLAEALGFDGPKSLIGRSYFDFIYPEDVQSVTEDIKKLYETSYNSTGYYRLLNQSGESIWVITEMQLLVQNIRGVCQKSVICSHQILTELDVDVGYQSVSSKSIRQSEESSESGSSLDEQVMDLESHFTKHADDKRGQKDMQTALQDHLSLAPFVPSDTLTLTQFNNDDDMPGLLPVGFEQWLCFGSQQQNGNMKEVTPVAGEKIDRAMPTNFGMSGDLQVDFGDVLLDPANFSIEEMERVFSEFDPMIAPTTPEFLNHVNLVTTPALQVTLDTIEEEPECIDDFSTSKAAFSRPRAHSMHAGFIRKVDNHRRDSKTVESFLLEMDIWSKRGS